MALPETNGASHLTHARLEEAASQLREPATPNSRRTPYQPTVGAPSPSALDSHLGLACCHDALLALAGSQSSSGVTWQRRILPYPSAHSVLGSTPSGWLANSQLGHDCPHPVRRPPAHTEWVQSRQVLRYPVHTDCPHLFRLSSHPCLHWKLSHSACRHLFSTCTPRLCVTPFTTVAVLTTLTLLLR